MTIEMVVNEVISNREHRGKRGKEKKNGRKKGRKKV